MLWNWSLSIILNTSIWRELISTARKLMTSKAQVIFIILHHFYNTLLWSVKMPRIFQKCFSFVMHQTTSHCWHYFWHKHKLFLSFKCNHYYNQVFFFSNKVDYSPTLKKKGVPRVLQCWQAFGGLGDAHLLLRCVYCVPDQTAHPRSTEKPCHRQYTTGSGFPIFL